MRVKMKVRERVRVTYTKRKSVGLKTFERVITLNLQWCSANLTTLSICEIE